MSTINQAYFQNIKQGIDCLSKSKAFDKHVSYIASTIVSNSDNNKIVVIYGNGKSTSANGDSKNNNSAKQITYYNVGRGVTLQDDNNIGNNKQAPNCINRLFCCNSLPLAIFKSIINNPKNAEPAKAIHNNRLKPLKGVCDSLNNFFF